MPAGWSGLGEGGRDRSHPRAADARPGPSCRRRAAWRRPSRPRGRPPRGGDPGLIARTEIVDGADEVRRAAREQLRRGATQIKLLASGDDFRRPTEGQRPVLGARDPAAVEVRGLASPTSARRSWSGTAHGQPLHRAIVWQDRRTAERCDELRDAGHSPLVRRSHRPGARPLLLGHQARVAAAPRAASTRDADLAFGTVDSWLLWNLTGGRRCTPPTRRTPAARCSTTSGRGPGRTSCASCSACRVVPARGAPVERPLRHDRRQRPTAASRSAASPATSRRRCSARPASTPGMTKNTYGTGSFVLMNVGDDVPAAGRGAAHDRRRGSWPTAPSPTPSRAPSSSPAPPSSGCATASASSTTAAEIGPLAASVDDTEGVFLVPAFTGLGSPWWDPYARGTLARPHPRHRPRPPGPRRGGGDGLPDPRRRRRDGAAAGRDRSPTLRADGGASVDGPAAAAPGRPAPGARAPPRRCRRPPRSAPPTWPGWPKACGRRSTRSPATVVAGGSPTPAMRPKEAQRRQAPVAAGGGPSPGVRLIGRRSRAPVARPCSRRRRGGRSDRRTPARTGAGSRP